MVIGDAEIGLRVRLGWVMPGAESGGRGAGVTRAGKVMRRPTPAPPGALQG